MSSTVLSFKAGLVNWDEESKDAVPKRGQGTVSVIKSPDDPSLYSFKWAPRGAHKQKCPESDHVDLLLFPGDATWEHVTECDTGRVFALTYKSSGQRLLFWMQTPSEEGDIGELTQQDKKISEQIAKILEDDSMMEDEELPDADAEAAAPPPATTSDSSGLSDLLRNIQVPQGNQAASTEQQQQRMVPVTSISDAIPISQMVDHINSLEEDQLELLYRHIPEGLPKTKQELIRVIRSSQFTQSLDSFGSVLNNDGVGALVSQQLEYQYNGEGIEGFLKGARQSGKDDSKDKMEE